MGPVLGYPGDRPGLRGLPRAGHRPQARPTHPPRGEGRRGGGSAQSAIGRRPRAQVPLQCAYFPVADVRASASHYERVYGFAIEYFVGEPPQFAICTRDGLAIMLAPSGRAELIRPVESQGGTWDAFFWIDDAKALHAELAGARGRRGVRSARAAVRNPGVRRPRPRWPRPRLRAGDWGMSTAPIILMEDQIAHDHPADSIGRESVNRCSGSDQKASTACEFGRFGVIHAGFSAQFWRNIISGLMLRLWLPPP